MLPRRPLRPHLALIASALMLTACAGSGAPSVRGDQISHPTGPNELILRVSTGGGFVAPWAQVTQIPRVSLFGDGSLITQGAQIAIFPGPAMPALQLARVTEAGRQRILKAATAAGLLGPDRHYDYRGVADAATTTFTVIADGVVHTVSAYALGIGADDNNVPADERQARALLAAFEEDMSDVRARLGSDLVGPDQPYVPRAVRVFVSRGDPATADDPRLVNVLDWPLTTALGSFGAPWAAEMRCGVLEGPDLDRLRADLSRSTQLTFWRSAGQTYRLDLRPLLPDEQGCPAAPS